ncbi:MAG: tetratricopeptide repeat protein [Magnetococcales bacterium]|nr:tetratricopeptide repeat protein [Magnetococcales bacterium]
MACQPASGSFQSRYSNHAIVFWNQCGHAQKFQDAILNFDVSFRLKIEFIAMNFSNMLKRGLKHHQAGQLQQAEAIYRQMLSVNPDHADANHFLGVLASQVGRHELAVPLIRKALQFRPAFPQAHFNLGQALKESGKLAEAIGSYEKALSLQPNFPEAFSNLGCVHEKIGNLDEAILCHQKALQLRPDYVEGHCNLGNTLKAQGKLKEAVVSYRTALGLKPAFFMAHNNLGQILMALGALEEAVGHFKQALALNPDLPESLGNLGNVLQKQGKYDEAVAHYHQAIAIRADIPEIFNNLGNALCEQGMQAAAISNYQKALKLKPNYPEAYNNLGSALQAVDKLDEAIANYQKALALKPDFSDALGNLGVALHQQGSWKEAFDCYRQAYTLNPTPGLEVSLATLLPPIPASSEEITKARDRLIRKVHDLQGKEISISDPYKEVRLPNFYLAYHGLNDREIQKELAKFYLKACPSLAWTSPHVSKWRPPLKKIRIGFVSNHLHGHTIGKLNEGVIGLLNRDRFEICVFRLPRQQDDISQRIDQSADHVIFIPKHLEMAREIIAEAKPDILFYPDIGMELFTYFLAFARLAPIQCTTWGHPVTTGIPNMDYFISSRDLEPDQANAHYTEQLVLMKYLSNYYLRPEIPHHQATRSDFGLPKEGALYVCPQSLFKFHPDYDFLFAELLRKDSNGWLVLIEGSVAHWTQLLKQRLVKAMPDVADRILFLPRLSFERYIQLIRLADVMLDLTNFGGGNTSYEAFAVNTPIVTWPGDYLRGRITLACYRRMGILDLVAQDGQTYVELAVRLTRDSAWREKIVSRIRKNSPLLFNNIEAVRELGVFFVSAVENIGDTNDI